MDEDKTNIVPLAVAATSSKAAKRAKNADRSRRFKAKMAAEGLEQVNVWLPHQAAAEFRLAAERILADRDLRLGPLVNERTGRYAKLNGPTKREPAPAQRGDGADDQAGERDAFPLAA